MIYMADFTPNQNTAFFTKGSQIALPNNIRAWLVLEGLVNVDNLDDFKEYQINQAFKNICTSITGITAVGAAGEAAAVPTVSPIPPVLVSAKCALRIKVASIEYHYHVSIGRDITLANMNYTHVLKGLNIEYESLFNLTKDTNPDVPLLYNNQTLIKWIESFKYFLFCT